MTMGFRRCPTILAAAAFPLALLGAESALAAWTSAGSGAAAGAATTMPAGNTPAASGSSSNVTVSWSPAAFPNGAAVGGYIIHRYDAATGASQVVGAGCGSTVTTTSCTEQNVPDGSWVYTDRPVQQSWTGRESADSNTITVSAAAALAPAASLAPPTTQVRTQASPKSLDLGGRPVRSTSPAKAITVRNGGRSPLRISSVKIAGPDPGDFKLGSSDCRGKAIDPGQTCVVLVAFTPSAGGRRSATLTLVVQAGVRRVITLSGTGTTAPSRSLRPSGGAPTTMPARARSRHARRRHLRGSN
jgi:hypothetical protein